MTKGRNPCSNGWPARGHPTWDSFRDHGNRGKNPFKRHLKKKNIPLYICRPLLKVIQWISKIFWLWHTCEWPDHLVSSQVSQSILSTKDMPNPSSLLTADQDIKPFIEDPPWVEGFTFIHSVFILICLQRSLTHHCDFCPQHRLFWAEVSQDTMWLHPNLASHICLS